MTEKLYIDNPYLKETRATVIDKSFEDEAFLIKLDRTIFFPNIPGDQPGDLGTIEGKDVIDVYEDKLDIIHVLKEDIDSKDVSLVIDWENRFDLMQQHTGQHILSATFKQLFNAETIGLHMGEKYITIDIDLEDLTEEDIYQVETLSNKIIQSNFEIRNKLVDSKDVEELDVLEITDENNEIRMVDIDNIDVSPCYGTHVSSTGEIGLIKIVNTEEVKGSTRVSFVCGNRALEDYLSKDESIKNIALSLLAKESDILKELLKLKEDKEKLQNENNTLREELITIKAEILLDKKKTINNIDYIVENLGNMDKEELKLISSYLNQRENLIQIYKLEYENYGSFLISKSPDLDIDLKELFDLVSEKIIINGNVNSAQIQGSTSLTIINKVIEMFFKEIQAYFKY